MTKVRCSACDNEMDNRCVIKKSTVHVNKPRKCSVFVLNPNKVKEVKQLPTIKMSYTQKEKLKALYKSELKQLKDEQRRGVYDKSKSAQHPLTGDLSRFTTTAVKDKGE